nr:MAG TPA: hypothetical protein [Caudoviricetes sp.]
MTFIMISFEYFLSYYLPISRIIKKFRITFSYFILPIIRSSAFSSLCHHSTPHKKRIRYLFDYLIHFIIFYHIIFVL